MRNAFYTPLPFGLLRLSGPDRLAFLQRQVTNDMKLLRPAASDALAAALTAPTGKLIDVFLLFDRGDAVDILSLAGRAPDTERYLKSRIFFMDKVTVEPWPNPNLFLAVWGDGLAEPLAKLGAASLPAEGAFVDFDLDGSPALLVWPKEGLSTGLLVGIDQKTLPLVEAAGFVPASHEEYEAERITAGIAGIPELRGEYTPFELRLDAIVSASKGCYTGQEVLARQVTHDKITRRLCKLTTGAPVLPGSKVYAENKPVGEVTSTMAIPGQGLTALAVLRRPANEAGARLTIRWEGGEAQAVVEG